MDRERCYAEINLNAIANNTRKLRNQVNESALLMAVVKADGYGHGDVRVAETALKNGADWLGVATVDEGAGLRENNITAPILVLGYTPKPSMEKALRLGLRFTVFSLSDAGHISKAACSINTNAYVHIKIDTGMTRLGFSTDDSALSDIVKIARLPMIRIEGIFTHFAEADSTAGFTNFQLDRFIQTVDRLKQRSVTAGILHCANSAAITNYPETHLGMVRAGIAMYGLASQPPGLERAMRLAARITMVRHVDKNTPVSYGRTFITERGSVIATVAAGYADGVPRMLSNRGSVYINGVPAPIRGVVCMDQFMADVTDISGVRAGDEAVIIGAEQEIFAETAASICGTICYEIVCGIGKRVPRVYI